MSKKRKKPSKTEATLAFSVNGHSLSGEKHGGVWRFTCPDWPDLAAKWTGDTITGNIIDEFMKVCLAPARAAIKRLLNRT